MRHFALVKLIFHQVNSMGCGHLSRVICSASCFLGPPKSGTVASVLSIGRDVVGTIGLRTATGVFEILAGGLLAVAANFEAASGIVFSLCATSSGSLPACGGD